MHAFFCYQAQKSGAPRSEFSTQPESLANGFHSNPSSAHKIKHISLEKAGVSHPLILRLSLFIIMMVTTFSNFGGTFN